MKKNILYTAILVSMFALFSCSELPSDSQSGGNSGGTGSLRFTISGTEPASGGGSNFIFRPTANVKLDYIIVTCDTLRDSVGGNPFSIYYSSSNNYLGAYNTASGQTWSFSFNGTLQAGGEAFTNKTVSYSIP
jgi:hypothetical protein